MAADAADQVPEPAPPSSIAFEVFGRVQGVFFRKNTKKTADRLGLTGWVRNTKRGTVVGEAHGPEAALAELAHWLEHVGSPSSRIERAEIQPAAPEGALPETFDIIRPSKKKGGQGRRRSASSGQ